jgi:hypothetical protein
MSAGLKPMPLAAVLYAVTFDTEGNPTVQGKIYTDTAGRAVFSGDPARTLVMLQHAEEITARRLTSKLTDQLTQAIEEKRLLSNELNHPTD